MTLKGDKMTKPATKPKFPCPWHNSVFLGRIVLDGFNFDTYADTNRKGVMFVYGCEGHHYFHTQIMDFPIETFREYDHNRQYKYPSATVLNRVWEVAKKWWDS